MNKSTIAKTLAIASLVGCGVTACTSNPFAAKSVDNGSMPKTTEAGCGGSCGGKHSAGSCGGKHSEGKCGGKNSEGKCGGKNSEGKCGEGKCGGSH